MAGRSLWSRRLADPTPPPALRRPRLPALDAARALGVVAMVAGHTLDALLSPAARAHPATVAYWKARGLTAPLFMLVAGWAVTVAIRRGRATGVGIVRARLPRVALLFAVGTALRWPGWAGDFVASGDRVAWAHILAWDALQAIAAAFLVTAVVLALPLSPREERLLLAALVVAAVSLGLLPPAPLAPALPRALPALALTQAFGGTSPFPLVPWTGYFFAGALIGLLVGDGSRRAALAMAGAGAALVAATWWQGIGTAPPGEPALIAFRVGVILLLLAALSTVPAGAAARLAPLGRHSLAIYALHVPVVYGWSTVPGLAWRVGPVLGFPAAAAVAALVLVASGLAAVAGTWAWDAASARLRARGQRASARPAR